MKRDYKVFLRELKTSLRGRDDVVFKVCVKLRYKTPRGAKNYDLIKISSRGIKKGDRIVLVAAGMHGDEIFGPLTLMKHIGKIFDYARKKGVKLVVFPLNNPSGWDAGARYNVENDRGEAGNNDFVRYILPGGRAADDVGAGPMPKKWLWSSHAKLGARLPKETLALHRELKKLPLHQIEAVVDLHADNFIIKPSTYQYGFGDFSVYRPIVGEIRKWAKILSNKNVDSGYLSVPGYVPEVVKGGKVVKDVFVPMSDKDGFILRYDGTLPALFYCFGVQHCLTIELTRDMRQDIADKVNLAWIEGVIDLVANKK